MDDKERRHVHAQDSYDERGIEPNSPWRVNFVLRNGDEFGYNPPHPPVYRQEGNLLHLIWEKTDGNIVNLTVNMENIVAIESTNPQGEQEEDVLALIAEAKQKREQTLAGESATNDQKQDWKNPVEDEQEVSNPRLEALREQIKQQAEGEMGKYQESEKGTSTPPQRRAQVQKQSE